MSTVKEAPSGVRSREAGRSLVIQLWRWGLLAALILLWELGSAAGVAGSFLFFQPLGDRAHRARQVAARRFGARYSLYGRFHAAGLCAGNGGRLRYRAAVLVFSAHGRWWRNPISLC